MLPIVPLVSAVMVALGGYGLYWYHNLDKIDRDKADRLAADYALRLYDKCVSDLTPPQLKVIHDLVKDHFAA